MKIDGGAEALLQRALQVPLVPLQWPLLKQRGIELRVRRDDQLDDALSGNKFYKLFFNLEAARAAGFTRIASFGGAYSNHLYALAAAGNRYGLQTIGLVRGEQPADLSPTLKDVRKWGMQLHFLPREIYRHRDTDAVMAQIQAEYGNTYLIPEGGANLAGCRGAVAIGQAIEQRLAGAYEQVCVATGTGTTLAGLAAGLPTGKLALGFSALKGAGNLGADIGKAYSAVQRFLASGAPQASGLQRPPVERCNWRLVSGYHGSGYGRKLPHTLRRFWREFESETGLLLDPVYTLKMFYGIACLAAADYWQPGTRLVAIHTGGLQGRRGFQQQIDWSI